MRAIPRERIALVVFVACLLLISAGIAAYFVAGHSWNYAATRIDDAAGEMDGYCVVLFEGTAIPAKSAVDAEGRLKRHPISLPSTKSDYQSKGATVFTIDALNFMAYAEPRVFERDGWRIGILHADGQETFNEFQESCDYLRAHGADIVIAATPSIDRLSKAEGIDIVIDLESHGVISGSQARHGSYSVAMPGVGSIGAIVISPSEVVSSRVIR